ncbi:hypothetical protein [Mycobacterium aquaticum]|uniref:PE-PPE domain-containing protein n=1 Tax=Mycobacterium aquaticum TaxID=1927124 RepID=A0A1X0AUE7_9MYCO|nr:hypothetical protein [Mycobacterium aquaticum]ORA33684.1 hypothetical protein BST13_19025 [Mycobacterium aquaticum]
MATALACAACIAAAAAIPGVETEAAHIANSVAGDVQLSAIDLSQLAWLNGIPAWQTFLSTGDLSAFVPAADGSGGYAALSALASYQNFFATGDITQATGLGGIAAFSALPFWVNGDITAIPAAFSAVPVYEKLASGTATVDDLAPLSSVNALVAFSKVPTEGLQAFMPSADGKNPGYAALSGAYDWQQFLTTGDPTALSDIAAFSAIPNLKNFVSSGDLSAKGLGGIAAFSALPAFGLTSLPAAAPLTTTTKQAAPLTTNTTETPVVKGAEIPEVQTKTVETPKTITTALSDVTPPSFNTGKQDAPEQAPVTPDVPSLPTSNDKSTLPTGKPSNGSYSGTFKPNNSSVYLFGSGGGSNSADNGIRGWDKVVSGIKGALGGSSSSSSGG